MQDDLTDATRWAIEQKITQADRICTLGASYGGYAALMGAARATAFTTRRRAAKSMSASSRSSASICPWPATQRAEIDGRSPGSSCGIRIQRMMYTRMPGNAAEKIEIST
jgi:Prolyl oligopeptidase family